MSYCSRLKVKVEYEASVPRCATCAHHWQGGLVLADSLPLKRPGICNKHGFIVHPVGVCNTWQGRKTGEVLE